MSINEKDLMLVNRSGVDYKVQARQVIDGQDTDYLLINRDGVDYKTTIATLKDYVDNEEAPEGDWFKLWEYLRQFDSGISDARWSGTGKEGAAKDYVYMGIEWKPLGLENYHEKTGLYRVKRADWDHKSPLDQLEKVFYFHELPPDIHGAGTQLSGQDGGYWIITEDLIIKDRDTMMFKNLNVTLDGGKTWKTSPTLDYLGEQDFLGAYIENMGGGKYKFLEAGGDKGLTLFNRYIEVTIDSAGGISSTGHPYLEYPYSWPVQPSTSSDRVNDHIVDYDLVCKDSNGYYAGFDWNVYRWTNFTDAAETYMLNEPADKPAGVDEFRAIQMYWDSLRNKYLLIGDWHKDYNPKRVGFYEFAWGDTTPTKHPLMDIVEDVDKFTFDAFCVGKVYKNNEVVGWTLSYPNRQDYYRYDVDGYRVPADEQIEPGVYGSCESSAMWTTICWGSNHNSLKHSVSYIYSEKPPE